MELYDCFTAPVNFMIDLEDMEIDVTEPIYVTKVQELYYILGDGMIYQDCPPLSLEVYFDEQSVDFLTVSEDMISLRVLTDDEQSGLEMQDYEA